MAYMRGEPYVYPTETDKGETGLMIHSSGSSVFLPLTDMEELAVMVLARLDREQFDQLVLRTLEKHGANFGTDALQKSLGLPTAMDFLEALAAQLAEQNPHLAQGGFPPS